ncbi:unnamed protein product [Sphenostylis stenocarpa]|uniref:Uncharacterized protein n=1 Tax=Sphenostylis stenocarpa TaxID=92480 RepID=A0AA86SEC4_9FABA|nr:unnamed protein product [Sphenostylis stenocarpa]
MARGGVRAATRDSDASILVRWLGWTIESGWELVVTEVWCKLHGAIHNGAVVVGLLREAKVARGGLGLPCAA